MFSKIIADKLLALGIGRDMGGGHFDYAFPTEFVYKSKLIDEMYTESTHWLWVEWGRETFFQYKKNNNE